MPKSTPFPVIDLFAGPGGLAEGFSSVHATNGTKAFSVGLSIEKECSAHKTLELRALYRALPAGEIPDAYYGYLRGEMPRAELFKHPEVRSAADAATREAKQAELGLISDRTVDAWIGNVIGTRSDWILIGGPPCQAYSLAGRARQSKLARGEFEKDHRHLLYEEYLRIIRKFHPAVFVMENVKGMLSATYEGRSIFDRVTKDLSLEDTSSPHRYELRSFVCEGKNLQPSAYVIESESYGVPQTRHRVILLGVRDDLARRRHRLLTEEPVQPSVGFMLDELPKLRGKISRGNDSHKAWLQAAASTREHFSQIPGGKRRDFEGMLIGALATAHELTQTGSRFVTKKGRPTERTSDLLEWLRDPELRGWCNHESRGNMPSDIQRYLFASIFAELHGGSPRLRDFPRTLLPDHLNVHNDKVPFVDRFRVQLKDRPSTTVVSHIAKDGHYFIHPDMAQARSLTVREAARLQTFPDNYFFEGNRTEQFTQVGNAVPPWLAKQLGEIVRDLMLGT